MLSILGTPVNFYISKKLLGTRKRRFLETYYFDNHDSSQRLAELSCLHHRILESEDDIRPEPMNGYLNNIHKSTGNSIQSSLLKYIAVNAEAQLDHINNEKEESVF